MPRIKPVGNEQSTPNASYDIPDIMAHRPEVSELIGQTMKTLYTSATLPARLIELIRLRIAFHNQCRSCMAVRYEAAQLDGLTEELVCSLERPEDSPDLTAAERAALSFADLFATNHLAIDDATYEDLRQYYDEGQIVELGYNCAMDVGLGRLMATWKVTENLPERFRTDGLRYTPWEAKDTIVFSAHADKTSPTTSSMPGGGLL